MNTLLADPEDVRQGAQRLPCPVTGSDLGVACLLLRSDFGDRLGGKYDSKV
jgi:hypothetical protein